VRGGILKRLAHGLDASETILAQALVGHEEKGFSFAGMAISNGQDIQAGGNDLVFPPVWEKCRVTCEEDVTAVSSSGSKCWQRKREGLRWE